MKLRYNFMVCVTLLCSMVMLSGCGDQKKTDTTKPAVKKLVMATEATFPPYEYFEKGKIMGIDVDIVSEVAKNLGMELEIMDMKFDSVILSVQTGKCNIGASGITATNERRKLINFTVPYVTAQQVIIVPKNSAIKKPEDLKDKKVRIGVQQGTTGDLFVAKNLHEPQRFDNAGLAVAALLAKKLEAVVCDGEPARVHVSKHPELIILPVALTSEEYAFALNKKDTELLKQINGVLIKMRKSGRIQAILDSYLNKKK